MSQTRPLGAQISHMLKDRGVEMIFGIPGVHNQEMYRGIEEAGITHVLARHEQGAGFMADGYARATGKPGVAYVITGPGVCNVMTPLGQAFSDSVPLLVISSCLDEVAAERGQLHQMKDQRAAAETVCDWSEEARSPGAAYQLIDRALAEFEMQRPRSKHVQVPIALLEADAAPAGPPLANTVLINAEKGLTAEVVPQLEQARKPLFIFGGGAARAETAELVMKVLGHFHAAAFTSYAGRGVVLPDYPLLFGSTLARAGSADVIAEADLVVVVGCSLDEVDIWRKHLGHRAEMIRVDIDPEVLRDRQGAEQVILSDAFAFLDDVLVAAKGPSASDWDAEQVAAARARWRAETDAERPGIVPVCEALQAAAPEDVMVYSDMTQIAYVAKEIWDMPRPGHWHHPYGFGTLGYALPAGIGGAAARRGLPTMVMIGDYGFQYTVAELGAAVELGLSLPIIVWDNGKLKEIEDSMVRAQIAPNAVQAHNPDFCALARAYGAHAVAPGSLAEMQEAVKAAFEAEGPTVIYLTPSVVG